MPFALKNTLRLPNTKRRTRAMLPRLSVLALLTALSFNLLAQVSGTEVQAWGNIRGIRSKGQLFRLESSLRVVTTDWRHEKATALERFWTTYRRQNGTQVVNTRMDSLYFEQQVRDLAPGHVQVRLTMDPHEDIPSLVGAFFLLQLPAADFGNAGIQLVDDAPLDLKSQTLPPVGEHEILRAVARGLRLQSDTRDLRIESPEPLLVLVRKDPATGDLGLYFTLQTHHATARQAVTRTFDLHISGSNATAPAELTLFPQYPGNTFLGLGGNFRLQNRRHDPPVIDYCLQNLDVRMGRVELPWSRWHPSDTVGALAAARAGRLHPHVRASLEMAQRLAKMRIPVVLAAWFPPAWAAEGEVTRDPKHADGTWGNPLRQDRMEAIYTSLGDYIQHLKEAYGVDVALFSFNEADLGINVRQTAAEHAAFIKGFGEHLKKRGLGTKLLLGDTSDANSFAFVDAALDDPATWAYIGAVSFHSWRGWDTPTLLRWHQAADRINAPLIVGEGSIDAAAWRYPQIFTESHYALEEIKLYVRILAICQPQSILQWQLTADYAPLAGGGLFGNDSLPLQPTQRFWNLKQLALTPPNLAILPLTGDHPDLYATALGDPGKNKYAFLLVNDGPERDLVLQGLPPKLKRLRVYTTDAQHGAERGAEIVVQEGRAEVHLGAASFVSLLSE